MTVSETIRSMPPRVHAAGLFKLWGSEDEFDRANVEGTRRLLAVAKSSGVRSLVQIGGYPFLDC
jgi:nucleoside-diphosphate-sugar epimerase